MRILKIKTHSHWLKLQGLLKREFEGEKKIKNDPNDLPAGDDGCDSRAPHKARCPGVCALSVHYLPLRNKHLPLTALALSPQDEGEGKAVPARLGPRRVLWPVETILDKRVATAANRISGGEGGRNTVLLVTWLGEGMGPKLELLGARELHSVPTTSLTTI